MGTFAQKQNQLRSPVCLSSAQPRNTTTLVPARSGQPVLRLQRTLGNQAVQRMLQTHGRLFQAALGPIAQLQQMLGNQRVARLIQAKQPASQGKVVGPRRKKTLSAADHQYIRRNKGDKDDDWQVTRPGKDKPKKDDKDREPFWMKGPPPKERGFVPNLEPNPRKGMAYLGEKYTQSVNVTNESEAPGGTKYTWKHEMEVGSTTPAGKADLEGAGTYYPMIVRTVGDNIVVSHLEYQVPKQPKAETRTAAEVVVPRPLIRDSKLETEKGGKRRPFLGSMIVGENLVVTVEMTRIEKKSDDSTVRADAVIPGLRYVKAVVLSPGVYEIWLHAPSVGGALGHVAALPYDTRPGSMPVVFLRADIEPQDSEKTPDSRPADVAGAKQWLLADYENLLQERKLGNDAVVRQTQVNDPPPKSPLWVDILLGVATAALGGATAAIGMKIATKLVGSQAEHLHEAVKVFFETTMASTVTTALKAFGDDPSQASGDFAPHIRFFMATESALNTTERKLKQEELVNRVYPKIDALEKEEPGKGFRAAVELDRGLKEAILTAREIQIEKSFVQWVNFVTRGQLGTVDAKDPQAATDMSKQLGLTNEASHRGPLSTDRSAPGVVALQVSSDQVWKPELAVKIRRAYMHGMNKAFRQKIAQYKIKDMPFALVVRGEAAGRHDGPYAFSRNEAGQLWLEDEGHEYLELKGGGSARAGALKILNEELANEIVVPES